MPLNSPRSGKTSFPSLPSDWPDPILGDENEVADQAKKKSRELQQKTAEVVNGILDGRVNCTGNFSLAANSLITVIKDRRCGIGSVVTLQAVSASAGGEMGVYVSNTGIEVDGIPTFTINHGSDSRTDRNFRYTIFGASTIEDSSTGTETVPGPMTVVRVKLNKATGTQDITVPGFGTPTAAMFIVSGAEITTPQINVHNSFGATDGTNQWVTQTLSIDDAATTNTWRRSATDEVIQLIGGGGVLFMEANFDSWVTDGVRINITATTAGRTLMVVLFGGPITADVGTVTLATTGNSVTVTPGFQTEALFIAGPANKTFNDTSNATAALTMGYGSYDGSTILQSSYIFTSTDNAAAADPKATARSDAIVARNSTTYADLNTITSTAFNLTSQNGDLSSAEVGYMALNLGGGEAWAGVLNSPTSTGNNAWTGVGFKPNFGLLMPNMLSAVATNRTNAEAGSFGFSAFSSVAEACHSWTEEDAADPTNSESIASTNAIDLNADDQTAAFDATFASFDADGATLDFSVVDGTIRKWPALFIRA